MSITGTFEAFKEYVKHRPDLARSVWLYTLTPQGRVKAIQVDGIEWNFPAAEQVTVQWIRGFPVGAIEVISWSL